MSGPVQIVRCANQECPHHGVHRQVTFTSAGPDLWSRPTVVCTCGHTPQVLDRWSHPAPEFAISTAPEKRGRRG